MTRFTALPFALVLAAALVAGPAALQEPVFRSTSQMVPLYATVTDRAGKLVSDLQEQDFEIYDNGVKRPLALFKSDIQPITVVIMLDTSGSMTLDLDFLKDAAEGFILRLLPEDKARLGSFSEKIKISPRFTNNRDDLIRILRTDFPFGNGTYLWDAIDESMSALAAQSGRRVVLVFTDGADETSQRVKYDQVVARATAENFMIYAVGKRTVLPSIGRTFDPDRNLPKLAAETGGGYFYLRNNADLNTTFTRIAEELHRQYILGFTVDKLDGLVHKLDVRTTQPGMTVRTRRTYIAKAGQTGDPAGPPEAR